MNTAILQRNFENSQETRGRIVCYDEDKNAIFQCDSLELSWNNNDPDTSRIPAGTYNVVTNFSNRHQKLMYEITGVLNRTGIRIDCANYFSSLLGCIALGNGFCDINKDGELDILNSKVTNEQFRAIMGDSFTLTIYDIPQAPA